ncbi:MAG: hypothetical protein WKF97_03815 [Chitinophagaceae bacterium]
MRWILIFSLLCSINGYGQWKNYIVGVKGDTLNGVDAKGQKQGKWVVRFDELRGEPGYEEEGEYRNDKKEGVWRRYTLVGDLVAVEKYRWGNKDGLSQYFNGLGELMREENWKAINPEKLYDTIDVENVDKPDHYTKVVVKNEGAGIRHGVWTYYDPVSGFITKTENYVLGALQGKKKEPVITASASEKKSTPKPKEVLDYEKKNAGKKKIRVRDGSTGF